jgi:uncharacterized protein YciI
VNNVPSGKTEEQLAQQTNKRSFVMAGPKPAKQKRKRGEEDVLNCSGNFRLMIANN